jgi:choline dehydrogenase-like flavoprotein
MRRMDQGIDFLAQNLFGATIGFNYARVKNLDADGLATTYHELGTLRMGEDPSGAVVNPDCQLHFVTNL